MNIDKIQQELKRMDRTRRMLNFRILTLSIADYICVLGIMIMIESNEIRAVLIVPLCLVWIIAISIAVKKIKIIAKQIQEYENEIRRYILRERTCISRI